MICPRCRASWTTGPYCPACGYGGAHSTAEPARYRDLARIQELESKLLRTQPLVQESVDSLRKAISLLEDFRLGYQISDGSYLEIRERLWAHVRALQEFSNRGLD
jgi:hypothetical protein